MKYYVVIPAYNEQDYIALTLQSLFAQTLLPAHVIVVDDNSTDKTAEIVSDFERENNTLRFVQTKSSNEHLPGSKVINAFIAGLSVLDDSYDFIVKLDADLILPPEYFETIAGIFSSEPKAGIAGGFAYIEKHGKWVLENLTDKDHIRGAFKSYRKECFAEIGGLKPAMGWDTVDELLAKFYGWKVITDPELKVKHLKPTGANYGKLARFKQGEAFYALGYGFWITAIASAKLAIMKKKPLLFLDYVYGFWKARKHKKDMLVNKEQADFIRHYRWSKMRSKIFTSG